MSLGRAIANYIAGMFLLIAGVAFITGAAVMWGLPQLWHWFKPILTGWLA